MRFLAAVASLMIAGAVEASCVAPSFDAPPLFNAGPQPFVMTFANLNGDEWTDVVVGNLLDANDRGGLAVLMGKAGGSFAPLVLYYGDASIEAVAAGDFDRDGDDDLVILDNTHTKLIVLRNDRTTLVPVAEFPDYERNLDIAGGDFNGDGNADFAVAAGNNTSVEVFYGHGDLTFTKTALETTGGLLWPQLLVRDLDRDGKDDLVIAHDRTRDITIAFGGANGFTQVPYSFTTLPQGSYALPLVAGDFDGDRKLDLLVQLISYLGPLQVALIHNAGSRFGGITTTLPDNTSAYALAAGDFDGDGIDNLVLASNNGVRVGTAEYMTFSEPWRVASRDIDRDGHADVVAVTNRGITLLLNDGRGEFRAPRFVATPRAIADFNNDGRDDILGDTRVWLSQTDGTFTPASMIAGRNEYGDLYEAATGDLNHDGHTDFVYLDSDPSRLQRVAGVGDGSGNFNVKMDESEILQADSPARLADMDGDGTLDLVATILDFSTEVYTEGVGIARGNGDGTFGPFILLFAHSVRGEVRVGDFNGDGRPDLFIDEHTVALNDGNMAFHSAGSVNVFADSWSLDDLNGDGRDDIVAASRFYNDYDPSTLTILLSKGDGTFAEPVSIVTPLRADAGRVFIRDFNGDRKKDLLFTEDTAISNARGEAFFYAGDGTGHFAAPVTIPMSGHYLPIDVGDFNGDGVLDVNDSGYVRLGSCVSPPQHRRATAR